MTKKTKENILNDFKNIKLYTFLTTNLIEYELIELNLHQKKSFFNYLFFFENNKEYFTYYRGDDLKRYGGSNFGETLSKQLGKFFIVGFKGMSYFDSNIEVSKYCINENILIERSEELLKKINEENINFDETLLSTDSKSRIEEIFAIVHNAAEKFPEEKKSSPFISVTVGNENFDVAKSFSGFSREEKGFVIMGFEKESEPYIDSETLRKFNLQNNDTIDSEKEIMVRDVLWPDRIIGIFALHKSEISFIVNPWLMCKLKNTETTDPFIYIDQKDFNDIYKDLGYKNYIINNRIKF